MVAAKITALPVRVNSPHSLFNTYFKYVEKTESPLIFHRWSMIACISALLGRQFRMPFGDTFIYPNQYVMLIGDPGTRKSTAIKTAKRILSAAGYTRFSAERTSKEKFLVDLAQDASSTDGEILNLSVSDLEPREIFIVADEFNEFVGPANLEFLSMLGALWDWDDEANPFKQRLKTSKSLSIYQPTINILSGNTHAGFAEAFPPQALGQGFLSRLLLVYSEHSPNKFAFPESPDPALKQKLVESLSRIKDTVVGTATLSEKATSMLTTIYHSYMPQDDSRLRHYDTRRYTHLLKLCLIFAAISETTEIGAEHVLMANTLLTFTEHKMPAALGEFGKARNADVAAKIIDILTVSKLPVDIPQLWKNLHSDLDKPEDLNKLLLGLVQAGKIQYVAKSKSSSVQGYLLIRKVLKKDNVFVDYSLLPECKNSNALL